MTQDEWLAAVEDASGMSREQFRALGLWPKEGFCRRLERAPAKRERVAGAAFDGDRPRAAHLLVPPHHAPPLAIGPALERVDALQRQLGRVIPHVFVHPRGYLAGRPVREFYRAWKTACRAAGVPEMLFHDLRRTAVRNMERAGVPRSVATKITGHRSEAIYRRYAIVNDDDLRNAMQKVSAIASTPATGTIPGTIAALGRKPSR